MAPGTGSARPIGWWLKEADRRLDAAFDAALAGQGPAGDGVAGDAVLGDGVDRRGWQVLASLARGSSGRSELVAGLAPFDGAEAFDGVISGLQGRGWVTEAEGMLRLTGDGERAHAVLAPLVGSIRETVAAALPGEDYPTLIALLERLVTALDRESSNADS
jgi:hypothetical protein